ncbi:HTTM domain-containing protein [Kiritimatiellota bacterium B12222]|nr:HTTM domain-containing protein [Kiritimatiellota bacterium B12222]
MKKLLHKLWSSWDTFWFSPMETTVLDLIRIGLGMALLWNYAVFTPELNYFYGVNGVIPLEALQTLRENDPWLHSYLYAFPNDLSLRIFHSLLLVCLSAFTLGWKTSWVKWFVFIGHVSFLHRNPSIYYGADNIASSLLFILCLSPIGKTLSLDARRSPPAKPQARATVCIRFIQLQLCILYALAGLEKLKGDTWWSGDAVWIAMNNWEFSAVAPDLFAQHYVLINLLTYGTLAFEISYAFLIWNRSFRPWLLSAAVLLHIGIGWVMGLWWFALVMALGNIAFLNLPSRIPKDLPVDATT